MRNRRSLTLIILVMVIFFTISFITNILNSILVDVKQSFNLSLGLAGFLPFSFFIAYGVMSIPAGFLAEKYSNKLLLSISFLFITLACFIFAFNPTYWIFIVTLFVLGCSMAVLQVIINPMLRVAGGEEHFAFNSVLAQLVFGLASFLSPFLYIYLVNDEGNTDSFKSLLYDFVPSQFPWVSLYLIFGFIGLCLLLIVSLKKYPSTKNDEDETGENIGFLKLFREKWTMLFFLGIFCYVGIEQGVGNWISQYLYSYHGFDPQTTGATVVSRFWAMLTIGCLLGLVLLKFIDSRKVLILFTSLTIIGLLAALFGSGELAKWMFPAVGFFISVMWSIIFSLGLNSVSHSHSALSGILCTGIAGGALFPLLVGLIGEATSLRTGILFLIIPLIYILSIGFWARPLVNNQTIKLKSD